MATFDEVLTQAISVAPALVGSQAPVLSQGIGVSDPMTGVRAINPTLTDGIDISPVLSPLYGLEMIEAVAVLQSDIPNHHFNYDLADQISVTSALIRGFPAELTQALTVAASETVQRAITVIEALDLGEIVAPSLLYHLTLSNRIDVAAELARFLGGDLTDGFTTGETWLTEAFKTATTTEGVSITEAHTPQFLIRVVAADTISIDDLQFPQMLFNADLADVLEITAAYLSPGDSVTTWAMNTRTGAVTEYDNFAFNSFARLGKHYLGASDGGLFELNGDDDAGDDIVATIRSGFAQWSGSHLGSFKAAYLAVRGEGAFVLRVLSGDGKVYNYAVTAQSMRSVKINMGKGLRARYFAFELISTGQDFDLESLEFIPLAAQRRV